MSCGCCLKLAPNQTSMNRLIAPLKSFLAAMPIVLLVGCESTQSGSHYPVEPPGFDHHFKIAKGDSNMRLGYKSPPTYQGGDRTSLRFFEEKVFFYLIALGDDLKLIEDVARNAREKAEAQASAEFIGRYEYHVRVVGGVVGVVARNTNFKDFDYREFPENRHSFPQLIGKPDLVYRYGVNSYFVTAKSYIDDANHFIRNCKNDYEEVQKIGLKLESYLNQLRAASEKEPQ